MSDKINPTATARSTFRFADLRRGSRQERGYGAEWTRLRNRIMVRDCGLCQPCREAGRITAARAVDHKVNKADGGTDDESNLQAICNPCHDAKTLAEALRARGLSGVPRPAASCDAAGLPTDPRHPWVTQGGAQKSGAHPLGTDPDPSFAKCRNRQGGALGG